MRRAISGALQHQAFRRFFLASTVNRLGSMMTPVAYAFAVLHVDNSAGALSQVLGAQVGANVLCLLFGGVVADRFSRRTVLQCTYLSSALILGATAALLLYGHASVPALVVLGATSGAAGAFAMPAVQGIVPQLVPRADLQQANALMSFVRNGAQVLGPVVGSVLVAMGDASWALVVDAASYLAASVLLLRLRLPGAMRVNTGILHQLREGWGEFVSRTWLWVTVVAFCLLNAMYAGVVMVLGPLVAKNTAALGVTGWGWVMGAQAAGMLVSSVVLLRFHLRHPLRVGMTAMAVNAALVFGLGAFPATYPLMVAAFLAGLGTEVFGTAWSVALGENIPAGVLSRVSSYDLVGSFMAMPLGMLGYGALATVWDSRSLLVTSGCAFILIALAPLAVPSIRGMGRVRDDEAQAVVPQSA